MMRYPVKNMRLPVAIVVKPQFEALIRERLQTASPLKLALDVIIYTDNHQEAGAIAFYNQELLAAYLNRRKDRQAYEQALLKRLAHESDDYDFVVLDE